MDKNTRNEVYQRGLRFVDDFLTRLPQLARSARLTMATRGQLMPFHQAVLPEAFARIPNFERSFSTSLGNCFQDCAVIIARGKFQEAKLRQAVVGQVAAAASTTIAHLMDQIENEGMRGRYRRFVSEIVNIQPRGMIPHRVPQVDLSLLDKSGNEYYFEMRSPKPNQSQCLSATRKSLEIHAIKRKDFPRVQTYCSMAYNPYGTKQNYNHNFAVRLLDLQDQVLVGEEFWSLMGDSNTYGDLLDVFGQVGRLRRTELLAGLRAIMP